MNIATSPHQRLSREILLRVLFLGIIIVTVATITCYYLVYNQNRSDFLTYLRHYMRERQQLENQTFIEAYDRLTFFRDEFMKLYLSDLDFSDDEFWERYFVDEYGATRMKEEFFHEGYSPFLGRRWGLSSFIGNNQSVESHELKRRLLLANMLVSRYGPAWKSIGVLHATFPENMITIYYPEDPWGLNAKPDLPMNELSTIEATLQSKNPERKPVWTGLYYDETANKWTITLEIPVDYQGRHLINPSMDVQLESIMRRLESETPANVYNCIFSKNGYLVAHPGELKNELKREGQLSLEKIGDPDLLRMYQLIQNNARTSHDEVSAVEDKEGKNYLIYASLAGPEWWYVSVFPNTIIEREAHQTSRIVLIFGFSLFLLYYIVVILVISSKVRSPLQRLQRAVALVAKGEYREVIQSPELLPLEQKNEIGQLAGMFLDMCEDVNDVHTNLQNIVASRTQELEQANAKLRELSLLDGLTGIHNRRSFDRDIERVFHQAASGVESFVLMLADVDNFKDYNDMYGHTAGDEALRAIAEVIAANIRKDDRVYRYGGEEIAVIFNNVGEESARRTGERIIEAVRELGVEHKGSPHRVITLSAGLVEHDGRFAAVTDMVNAADASLYEAKAAGKNRLRVSDGGKSASGSQGG